MEKGSGCGGDLGGQGVNAGSDLVPARLGCLLSPGPPGEEEGQDDGEGQELRHDVQRERDQCGRVAEPGQGPDREHAQHQRETKSVARVGRTMGDRLSSSNVVISIRNRGTKNSARYKAVRSYSLMTLRVAGRVLAASLSGRS